MLHLSLVQSSPLLLTDTEISRIHKNWELFTHKNKITVNDTLLRYLNHTATTISVAADIRYKDIVGLRYLHKPTHAPFLALSAIAFVCTRDGYFLLQTRDSGDWPKSLELPGGFIRASMTADTTETFIKRRVARDLELAESAIDTVTVVDIFPFPEILEQMIVFAITLHVTAAEITTGGTQVEIVPSNYRTSTHHNHFALPLHYPSQIIWETYFERLRK